MACLVEDYTIKKKEKK